MATAEALLAQTVTRPEAAAHKPARESATVGDGQSFAEILDAAVDADGESDMAALVVAPATQPAPAMNVATQLAFMAGLGSAAPTVAAPNATTDATPIDAAAAPALAATPAIAPFVTPHSDVIAQPANPATSDEPVAASAPAIQAAPVVAPAPVAAPASFTPAPAAPTPVHLAQPARPETPALQPALQVAVEVDTPVAAPVADATPAPAIVTDSAAAIVVVAETAATVAPEAGKLAATPATKPVAARAATPGLSNDMPTAPVAAAKLETAEPVDAISTISPGLDAKSGTTDAADPTPAQPAAGQPVAQGTAKPVAAAATATNAAPDITAGAPAASSGTSTSVADTLTAARAAIATPAPSAPAQTAAPQLGPQTAPSVAVQVYTRFVERFDGRAQRFEISLQPAELGRVDVRIEVGADRKVHAVLAAHDGAALSDLMRGQRALERALNDAGVDLAKDGLKFELSQDAGRGASGWRQGDAWADRHLAHAWRAFTPVDVGVEASPTEVAAIVRPYARSSRLDLVA